MKDSLLALIKITDRILQTYAQLDWDTEFQFSILLSTYNVR